MAITKAEGRTYDMLRKDARVRGILLHKTEPKVIIEINTGDTKEFDNWEAARNWVRKNGIKPDQDHLSEANDDPKVANAALIERLAKLG